MRILQKVIRPSDDFSESGFHLKGFTKIQAYFWEATELCVVDDHSFLGSLTRGNCSHSYVCHVSVVSPRAACDRRAEYAPVALTRSPEASCRSQLPCDT